MTIFSKKLARFSVFLCSACLFLLPVAYLLFSLLIIYVCGSNDYRELLHNYARNYPNAFDIHAISSTCFTESQYQIVHDNRWTISGLIALILATYLIFFSVIWGYLRETADLIKRMLLWMASSFIQLSPRRKTWVLLLFGTILIYRAYFYVGVPMLIDEVCSYVYFAHEGLLITALSYPKPNNHILFNLICGALDKMPWIGGRAAMRLPSVLGDLFFLYLVFCLFNRWGEFRKAIIVIAGTGFCYFTSFYAVQGRGYSIQATLILVAGMAWWASFERPQESSKGAEGIFIISSVAAFYIVPTYLYYFLAFFLMSLYVFIVRRDNVRMKKFIWVGMVTTVIVFILYLPLILVSGWSSLITGSVMAMENFKAMKDIWGHFASFSEDVFYCSLFASPWLMVLFSILFLHFMHAGRLRAHLYFIAVLFSVALIISMLLMSIHSRSYPYDRTLVAWILGLHIIFMSSCYDLWKHYSPNNDTLWIFGLFLLFKMAISLRGMYFQRNSIEMRTDVLAYRSVVGNLERLEKLHPKSWQITRSDDFYPLYLRWRLISRNDPSNVVFGTDSAKAMVVFLPDIFRDTFNKGGLVLWEVDKSTVQSKSIYVYIDKKLISSK
jgi:hypothetical protein